jgi:hypothetical protein
VKEPGDFSSGGGTRTHNKRLNRPVLCRLSYPGIVDDRSSAGVTRALRG